MDESPQCAQEAVEASTCFGLIKNEAYHHIKGEKMFDLKQAIKKWRKELHKDESMEDGYITELESHLKDEIENQLNMGKNEEEAFNTAVKMIGPVDRIGAEFHKTDSRGLISLSDKKKPKFMPDLLWNYMKVALRKIRRHKVYSFINIFGLAVGMACCILIMLFVQDELSYDRFHEKSDRIYRITSHWEREGREFHYATTRNQMGPDLIQEIPEIKNAVRLWMHRWFVVEHEGKRLTTDPTFADPSLFEVFTFPLIRGSKEKALADPNNVVISESFAEKIFGDQDPMGKVLTLYSTDSRYDLKVTGIMENIPQNSHFHFDFLLPLEHLRVRSKEKKVDFLRHCLTYVLLDERSDPEVVKEKIQQYTDRLNQERQSSVQRRHRLQPLTSIHLHSDLALEAGQNSSLSSSYLLSAVALVILLIACINFMNLSTARSSLRGREVGMRKVLGANRLQIFRQFLGESMLLAFNAVVIGLALAAALLPFFNSLVFKQLSFNLGENFSFVMGLFLLVLLVGFLAGAYPAVFLSSFRPVDVFKIEYKRRSIAGVLLRKVLVVFQFALSLVFIIGTLVVFRQLNYVKNKDLGFDKNNVISIPIFKDKKLCERPELIKRELGQHPNVVDVVVTEGAPGSYNGFPVKCVPEGYSEDEAIDLNWIQVGEDFFDFFKVGFTMGRDFSKEITSDQYLSVILNETAVRILGWTNPVGKQIKSSVFLDSDQKPVSATVIGVVKDYHNDSLHDKIEPCVYRYIPDRHGQIFLRIKPNNVQETLAFLEKKWRELPTHLIFSHYFMDTHLENQIYRQDRREGKIFTFSAILAIVLACLGLFGLASFTAERRVKEIGIRKVLGASASKIVILLGKDFSLLVLIANVVAWPIGYYVMHRWLQDFAYRISIGWLTFALAGILVFVISLLTISYHSLKAAHKNPAETLRYE